MKQQESRKELLTYANIRRDLRRKLWKSWVGLALCLLILIGIVYVVPLAPEILFTWKFWFALI